MKRVFAIGTTLIALGCGSGSALAAATPSDIPMSKTTRALQHKPGTTETSPKASWQSGAGGPAY